MVAKVKKRNQLSFLIVGWKVCIYIRTHITIHQFALTDSIASAGICGSNRGTLILDLLTDYWLFGV
jgi:hypothetical protein